MIERALGFSDADIQYGIELLEAGALEIMEPLKIDESHGVILGSCPDGRRFPEIFLHHLQECHTHYRRLDHCIHPIISPGGGASFSDQSPLGRIKTGDSEVLNWLQDLGHIVSPELPSYQFNLWKMEFAIKNLDINTFADYIHWPCKAALDLGLTLKDLIRYQWLSKQLVRSRWEKLTISCFVHFHYGMWKRGPYKGTQCFKTWHLSKERFRSLYASELPFVTIRQDEFPRKSQAF
jgi:hypothetical protein